jgi:nucleotide-binding universal stress UspA family protein
MQILVGYDGSVVAGEALVLAIEHARVFGAGVHVVTSIVEGTEKQKNRIIEAESGLEYAKGLFTKKEIPCETHLLIRGLSPGEDLVQFAKEKKVDEIIVGVKKRSKVGKLLMGSVAQYVILDAPCPVVSIR